MSVKHNVIANYIGQGLRALLGLAFVPLYIKYLGIEAYGLIGLFAVLQAWLVLLDMGMRPALGREMARFCAGLHDAQSIRDLLRTGEVLAALGAVVIGVGVWSASGWLATGWLHAEKLPVAVVARAFSVMGVVTALSFIENLYISSISGLQRQVLQNVISSALAIVRGLGAVAILAWVSPTITAFFAWQGLVSFASVLLFAGAVYGTLPSPPRAARFSRAALRTIWRFAAGMMGITLLSLLIGQVDKVLLSRLLSLRHFAHYALAGAVAGALDTLAGPISNAFFPHFAELAGRRDETALAAAYHQSSQLVSVLVGSAGLVLAMFSHAFLRVWTGNLELADAVAPVMRILVLGTLVHGLMWMPYQLQLAYGWTSLAIKINTVAVALLLPALFLAVSSYGAIGAACVWLALNVNYLVFAVWLTHRRLLTREMWRWYVVDTAIPITVATATAWLCRLAMPRELGRAGDALVLAVTSLLVLLATVASAPLVRQSVLRHLTPAAIPSSRGHVPSGDGSP